MTRWLFLTEHHVGIATVRSVFFAALAALQIVFGHIYVGPGSNLSTVLSSGLLSGPLTLLTIALSINQLIHS